MRIGIYAAALPVCGGGEKYIGKVAEILSREYDVSFIVFEKPDLPKLQSTLNIDLSRVTVDEIRSRVPLRQARFTVLKPLVDMVAARQVSKRTREYDIFINQEHSSIIRSFARRSVLVCEVPPVRSLSSDNFLTRTLFDPRSRTYDTLVVNSAFTRRWAEEYYGRTAVVLFPPVDTRHFTPRGKQKIILSVGRFSTALHCKKQLEMVRAFKELSTSQKLTDWEYHLAGALVGGPTDKQYLDECRREAEGYPIVFHVNAPFETLKELYGRAAVFWHATGLGESQDEHPERMEHFGITTVEAMSAGCVPVVIRRGGQPEIVQDTISGFLFDTVNQLVEHTAALAKDNSLWETMSAAAVRRSQEFSLKKFEERLNTILGAGR